MDEYLCINDVFTAEQKRGFENLPVKGETYTLKEEVQSTIDNKIGLVFYELPNPSHPNGQEYSFRPSRFVKVDKTKGQTELVEEKELVLFWKRTNDFKANHNVYSKRGNRSCKN